MAMNRYDHLNQQDYIYVFVIVFEKTLHVNVFYIVPCKWMQSTYSFTYLQLVYTKMQQWKSFSHHWANFYNILLSVYRVMRLQALKIGQNLLANMEGFHRDSHILSILASYHKQPMERLLVTVVTELFAIQV